MRALILLIGDELLNGLKADSNGRFLSARCLEIGIEVQEIRIVPDRIEAVVKALNDFVGRAELVFISGGLGPTVDDITRDALAEFLALVHANIICLRCGGLSSINNRNTPLSSLVLWIYVRQRY